ncbi:MAG TPA: type II toxin-antitoxin system VapC family toxin [Polyangiaceae bacterium]|nr:type II toxin-antitoxin system VapC family toxin [Polyangiaceae bacterium]
MDQRGTASTDVAGVLAVPPYAGSSLSLRHALKLPGAFQLAVALEEGCYALVTRDRDFDGVSDMLILGASRRSR